MTEPSTRKEKKWEELSLKSEHKSPEAEAQRMLEALVNNDELNKHELLGFAKGAMKGKTMDTALDTLFTDVLKQFTDLAKANNSKNLKAMKQASADLRNSAGCYFLKLQELEKKGEKWTKRAGA